MKLAKTMSVWMVAVLFCGANAFAQDAEVPLTWKGEGEATFISGNGADEIDFDLEFHVDSEGMVSGKTSNGDGSTELQRFYYSEEESGEYPALDSRKLVLVLQFKGSDTPWLIIMKGLVLGDKYFYGNLYMADPDADGMDDNLNLGDKMATPIYGSSLPSGLKKAIDKSAPMGYFEVKGKLVKD